MPAKEQFIALLGGLGIEVKTAFVPWSQSRNKHEKHPSLNWRYSLIRKGKEFLSGDYFAGHGHCPSYSQVLSVDGAEAVQQECETGRTCFPGTLRKGQPIRLDTVDLFESLLLDAGAIDYATFEDWAADYGYDVDSRKAEAIYKECLRIGLALRVGFGNDNFELARELIEKSHDD